MRIAGSNLCVYGKNLRDAYEKVTTVFPDCASIRLM